MHRGRTHAGHRLLHDQILHAIGQHDSDLITTFDAARHQRVTQAIDGRVKFAPGQPTHTGLIVFNHRFAIRLGGGVIEHRQVRAKLGLDGGACKLHQLAGPHRMDYAGPTQNLSRYYGFAGQPPHLIKHAL